MKSNKPLLIVPAFAAMLVIAGCADDGGGATTGADQNVTAEKPNSAFVCDDSVLQQGFGNTDAPVGSEATIVSVRAAGHPDEGFDRFVVEFSPGSQLNRYSVRKKKSAKFNLGESDQTIQLEGEAGIEVLMGVGPSWVDYNPNPARFKVADGSVMREAAVNYIFEGDVGWAIGLAKPSCVRAFKLADPPRLVVDVQR